MSANSQRRRAAPTAESSVPAGLQQLNRANDDARLDELLRGYFRLSPPAPPRSSRAARGRRQASTAQSSPEDPASEADPEMSRERCLKHLKQFLREHSSQSRHITRVFDTIQFQLKRAKRTQQLLPLIVTLCQELFARSVAFRAAVTTQTGAFYGKLLEAAGEPHAATPRKRGLVGQQSERLELVLALVESWRDTFGVRYPALAAGYALLEQRGYEFPHVSQRTAQRQRQAEAQQAQQQRVQAAKEAQRQREMAQRVPEMESVMQEMDRIFEILVPTLDAFELEDGGGGGGGQQEPLRSGGGAVAETAAQTLQLKQDSDGGSDEDEDDSDDGVDWENVVDEITSENHDGVGDDGAERVEWEDVEPQPGTYEGEADGQLEEESHLDQADTDMSATPSRPMDINEIVEAYGLGSSSYQLSITISTTLCAQSSENEALFRSLADGVLLIRKRFLPLVRDWMQTARANHEDSCSSSSQEVMLHSLQQRLEQATLKWEDLVQDQDKAQAANVTPAVVSLPLTAYADHEAPRSTTHKKQRRQ